MKIVKIVKKITFAILLCVSFLSCKQEEEEEEFRVILPANKGNDEMNGTKWEYFDKKNLIFKTWVFENGAATYKEDHRDKNDNSKSVIPTKTFFYTYTTSESEKLLYLRLEKVEQIDGKGTNTWSNGEEYRNYFGATKTSNFLEYIIESEAAKFYDLTVYNYKVSGEKIYLTKYFTGSMPNAAVFSGKDDELSIRVQSAGIFIDVLENGKKTDVGYTLYPRYDGKNFSGKLYKVVGWDYSVAGEAKGFYTSEGVGKNNSVLSFTFTSLPEGVGEIALNTAYSVKQSGSTYVFEQAKAE